MSAREFSTAAGNATGSVLLQALGSRLFRRFFVAFLLCLVSAALTVAGLAFLYHRHLVSQASLVQVSPPAHLRVRAAVGVYRHGGEAALAAFLAEESAMPLPPVLAVNDRGEDLLGRNVPAAALANARSLEASGVERAVLRVGTGRDSRLLFEPRVFDLNGNGPIVPLPPPLLMPVVVGLIACMVFAALLAWYFARPIRALDWALRSATAGRLDVRVLPLLRGRRDEISNLGAEFDRMAQRVESVIRSQRQLFHDVSHELRSPLARIEAAAGLAHVSPERSAEMLSRIERESERMDALVSEILTLARLDSGVDQEPLQQADLIALLDPVVENARFEGASRAIDVVFRAPPQLSASVRADMLARAVDNVMRNALRHAPAASNVELTAGREGDEIVVAVHDRGPGLPPTELDEVFRPFVRGSRSDAAGFGLGLAIAQRALRAHDGSIRAEARPGGGLTVVMRWPSTPTAGAPGTS